MLGGELSLLTVLSQSGNVDLAETLKRADITSFNALFSEFDARESRIPKDTLRKLESCINRLFAARETSVKDDAEQSENTSGRAFLSSGLKSLDDLLSGSSLSTHTVAEISGLPGSGKTVCSLDCTVILVLK
jgi:hypothetical protein